MEYLIKPLSKNMLASLQHARSVELSGNQDHICTTDDFKGTLSGLSRRGFVTTKKVMINGKEVFGVFVTDAGIRFLNRYNEDQLNWETRKVMADLGTYATGSGNA